MQVKMAISVFVGVSLFVILLRAMRNCDDNSIVTPFLFSTVIGAGSFAALSLL